MNEHTELQVQTAIANIKANILILEKSLETLKDKDEEITDTVRKSQDSIIQMKLDYSQEFQSIHHNLANIDKDFNEVQKDIMKLSTCVDNLEKSLSSNNLLSFTSELDIKKVLVILSILLTLISSPGIVTQWLTANSGSGEKLDKLIELLESNE